MRDLILILNDLMPVLTYGNQIICQIQWELCLLVIEPIRFKHKMKAGAGNI